jgi:hypothetical protein
MKEVISKGETELEKIVLPLSDYKKYLVEDHEIFIHNKLYDIDKYEVSEDSITFYCLHDFEEQQLLASLYDFFEFEEENTNSHSNSETQLLNFLFESSLIHQHNSLNKNSIYLASIKDITPVLQSQFITPNTLPPKNNLFS